MLDAGVLIGIDRGDRQARRLLDGLARSGSAVSTTEPVVAQVWRSGTRQARLANALRSIEICPFVEGRRVGRLLGEAGMSDVVDAHLVLLAADRQEPVMTGDPGDLRRLAATFGPHAPVIHAWP